MLIRTTEKNGNKNYVRVTPETINDLLNIMEHGYDQVRDSFDNFGFAILDNMQMEIMFEPDNVIHDRRKKHSGEFFPFYNRSEIDLEVYDIYRDEVKNTCCLLTAIENSKILNENEMNLLKSTIQTRCVNREDMKNICGLLGIYVKLVTINIDEKYTNRKCAQIPDADWLARIGCDTKLLYYGPKITLRKEDYHVNKDKR